MAGSSYGTIFRITTWGESHGAGVGVVIDGCPAGLLLSEEDIQKYLNRRKPGQSKFTTQRKESDQAEILSGVFEGRTTGTPISILIRNQDQKSRDYSNIMNTYRPGHADYTFDAKYGFRDYRGGGRSSGRETIGRVAAGAVACKILESLGIQVMAYTKSIGPVSIPEQDYDYSVITDNTLYMPNNQYAEKASAYLEECIRSQDSSIGAVKGFEIGDGFQAAKASGSQNNDAFSSNSDGIYKETNHSGGVLGGMSDGSTIVLRAAIKPTPSISQPQDTVDKDGKPLSLTIHGRHDPVIVPRAVVVVESMTAITLVDMLFQNMAARMDKIAEFYSKTR